MKRKRGISELTTSELQELSPIQKHQQISNLIPMQTNDCVRLVRLQNVDKRMGEGWELKRQNALQDWKVQMAANIHAGLTSKTIHTRTANKLFPRVAAADWADKDQVEAEINAVMPVLN